MADPRSISPWTFALLCALMVMSVRNALPQASTPDPAHRGGIWKAAVPPKSMHGEFDNFDPLGVAAGARIKADCSLNWIDPDDGKRYCFSSGTSLEFFLDRPQANIERARQGWRKMTAPQAQ
jgi:hypothetical protein